MKHKKLFRQVFGIGMAVFLVAACSAPAATPTVTPTPTDLPTSTPIPPTPTATPTAVPPTATSIPTLSIKSGAWVGGAEFEFGAMKSGFAVTFDVNSAGNKLEEFQLFIFGAVLTGSPPQPIADESFSREVQLYLNPGDPLSQRVTAKLSGAFVSETEIEGTFDIEELDIHVNWKGYATSDN